MTLYLAITTLIGTDGTDTTILGVFSTRDLAKAALCKKYEFKNAEQSKRNPNRWLYYFAGELCYGFEILEAELDKEWEQ